MLAMLVQELADDALVHIDDTSPPVFLRFVNLLINDAIYLLDEALQVRRSCTLN